MKRYRCFTGVHIGYLLVVLRNEVSKSLLGRKNTETQRHRVSAGRKIVIRGSTGEIEIGLLRYRKRKI